MPNNITNEIRIIGPEKRVVEFFKQGKGEGDNGEFSFKGFIVPPDHPDYNTGGCSHQHPMPGMKDAIKRMLGVDCPDDHPMLLEQLQPEEHPNCWFVWNKENWGTKWDAYAIKVGSEHTILDRLARAGDETVEETVQFDTAWCSPFPVFEEMIRLYPDCRFIFRWLSEDMEGAGGGILDTKTNDVIDGIDDPDDPETGKLWWSLARELRGYSQEQRDEYLAEVAEDERLTALKEAQE